MDSNDNSTSFSPAGFILLFAIIVLVVTLIKHKKTKTGTNQRQLYTGNRSISYVQNISSLDYMDGHSFEYWCADLLRYNGFVNIQITPGSGDQGVDIIAFKDGLKYAIQCKRYSKNLGNKPIQEVNTGRTIYNCNCAAVMTNVYFTSGAKEAARAVGVYLWDRNTLANMLNQKNAVLYRQSKEYRKQQRIAQKQQQVGYNMQETQSTRISMPEVTEQQPFCGKCGARILQNEKFCKYCGAPAQIKRNRRH